MSTNQPVKRSIVSLHLPKPVLALVSLARAMVTAMTDNPAFPNPNPALASVTAAIDELQVAQQLVKTRAHGAAASRNEKRTALVTQLETLRSYIQTVAAAHPETAESVIRSAGVAVRKPVVRQKQAFRATPGAVSGSVKLTTSIAARRAFYEWESSLDGGKTWQTLPATLQARTTVMGLTAGVTAMFRSRAGTKGGEGDWSQPVSIVVR
jgi:hypothetical protein